MIKFGTGGWRAVIGDEFTKEKHSIISSGYVQQNESRRQD